jgi:hypothetical protein
MMHFDIRGGVNTSHAKVLFAMSLAMLQFVLEEEYEFILAVEVPQKKRVASSRSR